MVLTLSRYIILWLITTVCGYANVFNYENKVKELFETNEIVPDVIPKAPTEMAFVIHSSGVEAVLGVDNEVSPIDVKDAPAVAWKTVAGYYYTLAMVDPDAPSRANPVEREFLHWLVVNIRGNFKQIDIEGEIIAEYVGPAPPPNTDLHRYVFLVYQQRSKLELDEPKINNTSSEGRPEFSVARFARKYDLGVPVAGNFYRASYDDFVPLVAAQMGDDSLLYCLTGEVKCH